MKRPSRGRNFCADFNFSVHIYLKGLYSIDKVGDFNNCTHLILNGHCTVQKNRRNGCVAFEMRFQSKGFISTRDHKCDMSNRPEMVHPKAIEHHMTNYR